MANRFHKVLLTSCIRLEVLDLQISEKEDLCYFSTFLSKMENPAAILDIEDGTFLCLNDSEISERLWRPVFSGCRLASLFWVT